MIPKEIKALELLARAIISGWTLEFMSTNWSGYWIIQLTHEEHQPLVLLVNLDNLTGICNAMQSCIDAANNPNANPQVDTMLITAASSLPTPFNDKGAVSVMSEWSAEPFMQITYYRGGYGEGNKIEQAVELDDAMRLSNMFAKVYNKFPDKQTWVPRVL